MIFCLDDKGLKVYDFLTVTIKDRVIAFLLRVGLRTIHALVFLKPRIVALGEWILLPVRILWTIVLLSAIPMYQIFYAVKRRIGDVYRPTKNRVMFVIANRHTVHVVIGLVLAIAFGLNVRTSAVRAEAFGEDTLMHALVASDTERFIEEEVVLDMVANHPPTTYMQSPQLISRTYGVATSNAESGELFASSSGLEASQVVQSEDSVAPREEIVTYAVQEGDTLSQIANKFGISLNTLLWANSLTARSSIRIGKELTILPTSGVLHTVARGDTISKIASRYGAQSDEILTFNGMGQGEALTVGAKLIVPNGEIKAVVSTPSSVGRVFASPTNSGTPGGGGGSGTGTGNMLWPTDLRVITQYFGWTHTGVDIDCYFTNDNYAADDGVVQFSGWKGGYGYAVEVKHSSGMVTRYGHHASLYVQAGQTVTRGQPLGRCGTTGHSTGTHLHFEVIVGGKYKNPLEYIR